MSYITNEAFLTQLGYHENLLPQVQKIEMVLPNFDKIKRHLIALNDHLKNIDGVVALSNTQDVIKIKSVATKPELINEFHSEIEKWANKYKVTLEKVSGKETYYIKEVA